MLHSQATEPYLLKRRQSQKYIFSLISSSHNKFDFELLKCMVSKKHDYMINCNASVAYGFSMIMRFVGAANGRASTLGVINKIVLTNCGRKTVPTDCVRKFILVNFTNNCGGWWVAGGRSTQKCWWLTGLSTGHHHEVHNEERSPADDEGREDDSQDSAGLLLRDRTTTLRQFVDALLKNGQMREIIHTKYDQYLPGGQLDLPRDV